MLYTYIQHLLSSVSLFIIFSCHCSCLTIVHSRVFCTACLTLTSSLDKSFEGAPKTIRERSADQVHSNKFSNMFGGTQDKCVTCKKTVYPIEKVAVDGTLYHKSCFRCTHGGCMVSPSNYVAHEQRVYCKHHHAKLFREKGNFSQFDKDQHSKAVAVEAENQTATATVTDTAEG